MNRSSKTINRTALNLALDVGVFTAFLVTTAPRFSGIAIHEWLGIAFGIAIITHLLLHWQWIVATTRRFLQPAIAGQRLNYVLNALLFISMTIIIFTGLVISEVALPAVGIATQHGGIWRQLHALATDFTVLIVGLHVALHWSWIVGVVKRLVKSLSYTLAGKRHARVPAPVRVDTAKEAQR